MGLSGQAVQGGCMVFHYIVFTETSFTLDLKLLEFSIVSKSLSTKLGEKGETIQRKKEIKDRKLYKEIQRWRQFESCQNWNKLD